MDEEGRRVSTFDAFIPVSVANKRKANLFVCTGVVASKVDLQAGPGGLQATGVYFKRDPTTGDDSTQFHVTACREVILCAGAIVSPQLLMLRFVTTLRAYSRSMLIVPLLQWYWTRRAPTLSFNSHRAGSTRSRRALGTSTSYYDDLVFIICCSKTILLYLSFSEHHLRIQCTA